MCTTLHASEDDKACEDDCAQVEDRAGQQGRRGWGTLIFMSTTPHASEDDLRMLMITRGGRMMI
eukprot:1152629-Pelagomonas_calceolata.AAC.1